MGVNLMPQSSRSRIRFTRLSLVAVTALSGCGLLGSHGRGAASTTPLARPVVVHVTNNNLLDVDVYAVAHGEAMWLGLAPTLQTTTFHLSDWFVNHGPMRVLVSGSKAPLWSSAF